MSCLASSIRPTIKPATAATVIANAASGGVIDEALKFAVIKAQTARVRARLKAGVDINARMDGDGFTPLALAIMAHQFKGRSTLDVIDVLIASRADLNSVRYASPEDEHTHLHMAAARGYTPICKQLVSGKADLNARDGKHGATPLCFAIEQGFTNTALYLIEAKSDVDATAAATHDTALHWAADGVGHAVVSALVEAKANVNAQNSFGMTPLAKAAGGGDGRVRTMRALVAAGADIDLQCTDEGVTPLHRASFHGYTQNVAFLLKAKASLTCRNHEGVDPLTMAMASVTPAAKKIVKLLRKAASARTTDSNSSAVECPSTAFFNCLCCRQHVVANAIKRCSRCHIAMYCSKACQRADWPSHKKTCKKHAHTETGQVVSIEDRISRGQRLEAKGQWKDAMREYRVAEMQYPDDYQLNVVYLNMGNTLCGMAGPHVSAKEFELLDQAISFFRKSIATDHKWNKIAGFAPGNVAACAHRNLGNALNRRGDKQEAITELKEAIRIKPGYQLAKVSLGKIYHQTDIQKALPFYKAALPHPEAQRMLSITEACIDMMRHQKDMDRFAVRGVTSGPKYMETMKKMGAALHALAAVKGREMLAALEALEARAKS